MVGQSVAITAGAQNVEHVGLHKDHINLVRFESEDDDDYEIVRDHISGMVKAITPSASPQVPTPIIKPSPAPSNSNGVGPPSKATGPLSPGRYRIQNAKSSAFVALQGSDGPSNIICFWREMSQEETTSDMVSI